MDVSDYLFGVVTGFGLTLFLLMVFALVSATKR